MKDIQRAIKTTNNTEFFRKAFLRSVNDSGFPDLIAIDYKIDLGLDSADDPDQRKLFNTILISCIILSIENKSDKIKWNFLLIANEIHFNVVNKFLSNTIELLDIIHTKNNNINKYIEELKKNPAGFNELFNFNFIVRNYSHEEVEEMINYYFNNNSDNEESAESEKTTPDPKTTFKNLFPKIM